MKLDSSLSGLAGLGPKTIEKLNRLGLFTARDLLFYFPRRYEDYTTVTPIAEVGTLLSGEKRPLTVKGTVLGIANKKTRRRGFTVTEAQVVDDTGTLKVVWFNQPYLAKMLQAGSNVILNGKIAEDYYGGGFVMESPTRANYPKIVPVYSETEGVSSWFISKIFTKLKYLIDEIEEWLPREFLISNSKFLNKSQVPNSKNLNNIVILSEAKNLRDPSAAPQDDKLNLLSIQEAIQNIHEPRNSEILAAARRRLAFDELFLISLQSQITKAEISKLQAEKIEADIPALQKFIARLPFELTGDQKKAIWQIVKDLGDGRPMNRLLSGDVGSGKTVVAAAAAFATVKAGRKAVLMVPTSILANQHYETFCKLFNDYDINIGLITSERREVNRITYDVLGITEDSKVHNTEYVIRNTDILIGTQALIQPNIEIENVALTIVDEQHRFGVRQRQALKELPSKSKFTSHFLSMTATPIPRTMYLALFGDLSVSFLIEKPANRKPVKTRLVDAFNRDKAYRFIQELINRGRQAFIICPLIEDKSIINDQLPIINEITNSKYSNIELFEQERKTVMAESEKLKTIFPEFKIATLHGRMKAKEKDVIMAEFLANRVNILVSTSVVEVGVDVPNAAVMLIEDAERFGLATIHQFRGRVGRADHQSFCFLFSNSQSEKAINRLKSLEEISDGYKLAEIDLETRGFGSILGTDQSGVLDMKMANFCDKMLLVEEGKAAAKIMAKIDEYPLLKEKIEGLMESKHLE